MEIYVYQIDFKFSKDEFHNKTLISGGNSLREVYVPSLEVFCNEDKIFHLPAENAKIRWGNMKFEKRIVNLEEKVLQSLTHAASIAKTYYTIHTNEIPKVFLSNLDSTYNLETPYQQDKLPIQKEQEKTELTYFDEIKEEFPVVETAKTPSKEEITEQDNKAALSYCQNVTSLLVNKYSIPLVDIPFSTNNINQIYNDIRQKLTVWGNSHREELNKVLDDLSSSDDLVTCYIVEKFFDFALS